MKLLLGDCLEKLKELDDNSVDSIVTDPPYGLSFMGKDWDKVKATKETKSQVVKGLGAGMKMTTLADNIEFEKWVTEWSTECYRVLKPGGYMLAFGGSRMYHRLASGVENAGFEIRDQMMWVYGSGFPKSMNIGIQVDKKLGNQREIVGEKVRGDVEKAKENGAGYLADPANRNNTKQFGYGTHTITKGNSDWEGWGTALKPAHEPIVMARKPISEKTVADNVLEWGTGGINIDGCRIETDEELGRFQVDGNGPLSPTHGFNNNSMSNGDKFIEGNPNGRFPANIIFDEEAGKILDEQIEGGASRFFYCPKTSKSDRSEGLDEFEKKVTMRDDGQPYGMNTNQFRPDGSERKPVEPKSNHHPTVKPTDLMAYLIRLVTPKGGIVLDPFMGSGSTGKAAVREGMDFIGIERETEYFEIAKSRIEYEINKPIIVKTPTGKKVEVRREVEEKVNQFFG
jgi:site-specific DNA-methyltransferase (adenine-specific)